MEEKREEELHTIEFTYKLVYDEPENHEHRYNLKGECTCGKVLPDIKPYPIAGGAQPWMR